MYLMEERKVRNFLTNRHLEGKLRVDIVLSFNIFSNHSERVQLINFAQTINILQVRL